MKRSKWTAFIGLAVCLAVWAACGGEHGQVGRPTTAGDVETAEGLPPLPEWAPENPSPEFVRAARVLKPLPDEMLQGMAGQSASGSALLQRYRGTMPSSYEFFGALDDRQIERFSTTKEIRIPVKSLTARQRAALDHWFESWRTTMKGTGSGFEDYLLILYKMGAEEDLSNVDVGFTAKGAGQGHMVHIWFWVRMADGKVNDLGTAFATI